LLDSGYMEFRAGLQERGLRSHVERLLHVESRAKPQVYAQVFHSADMASLSYWLELFISAGIATFGLVLNSPAVIIGAMLISPLMGPLMATGLALAVGDLYMGTKALLNLAVSTLAAVAFSAALVWALPFHAATTEILARTNPNLLDLGVALLSGLAGSLVVCRGGGGGGVMALPGVAIAVALMPPLCTVGYGVGSGLNWAIMGGAGLLFVTNLAAIVTAAFVVFFMVRMDAPDVRTDIDRFIQQRAADDRLYGLVAPRVFSGAVGHIGKLQWRIVMMALALAAVFFPLRNALMQVARETGTRSAVQEAVRRLAPSDTLVTQQVRVGADRIDIRLITTERIDQARVVEAREALAQRTGLRVDMAVREVASKNELAELRDRMPAPAAPAPPLSPEQRFAEMRNDLLARVRGPLEELWPSGAMLLGYEVAFSPGGTVLRIRYQADEELGSLAVELLQQALRYRVYAPELTVSVERIVPPPPPKPARRRG
jgi:uncharacterized hydrophobic protein (TIGR00271 family)